MPKITIPETELDVTYSYTFGEANIHFENSGEFNRLFLECQQNYFNSKLQAQGYVFLNDVLDALGFERTPAGQVVGWLFPSTDGDGYIDIGLYSEKNLKFIAGEVTDAQLEFNVKEIIFDKI